MFNTTDRYHPCYANRPRYIRKRWHKIEKMTSIQSLRFKSHNLETLSKNPEKTSHRGSTFGLVKSLSHQFACGGHAWFPGAWHPYPHLLVTALTFVWEHLLRTPSSLHAALEGLPTSVLLARAAEVSLRIYLIGVNQLAQCWLEQKCMAEGWEAWPQSHPVRISREMWGLESLINPHSPSSLERSRKYSYMGKDLETLIPDTSLNIIIKDICQENEK